jgi:transcriptional regulator with XRE-family HTH domain
MAHRKEPPTPFARAVRDARDRAGLTQAALAMVLNTAPSTIYRVEQGHSVGDDVEKRLRKWCRDLPPMNDSDDCERPTGT